MWTEDIEAFHYTDTKLVGTTLSHSLIINNGPSSLHLVSSGNAPPQPHHQPRPIVSTMSVMEMQESSRTSKPHIFHPLLQMTTRKKLNLYA